MKVIAYTRPDGGVSVITPAPEAQLPNETEAEFLARIRLKDVPANATNVIEVDKEDLPPRETRSSWRIVNGVVRGSV